MAQHPNVFISSTREDLGQYVTEVERLLLRHSCYPIGMENFNATNLNALQLCYDRVRQADIFIGIYAHRYGFCPTSDLEYKVANGSMQRGDGTKSITEWEYIWAKERGIPTLLFVIADEDNNNQPFPWPIKYVDGEPNKSRLEAFKRKVKNEFVGFFTSPDNLAKILSPALSDLLRLNASVENYPSKSTPIAQSDTNTASSFIFSVGVVTDYQTNSFADDTEVISVEHPLLLGVLVDVSRSMLKLLETLPQQSGISRNQFSDALNELVEKAILYCRTPEATQILPRFALFVYGFGFGRIRAAIAKGLARLGIVSQNQAAGSIPESNVRDLFAEIARLENVPTTPNVAELYESLNAYTRSLEAQIIDAGGGASLLETGLASVEERFRGELSRFNTNNVLLLIISDGQLDNSTDDQLRDTIQRIQKQGIHIVSCYISQENSTVHKTLYMNSPESWSKEAKRLFDCASVLAPENVLMKSLKEIAIENGWNIPDGARLFVQINNNQMLQEVIDLLISPLKIT